MFVGFANRGGAEFSRAESRGERIDSTGRHRFLAPATGNRRRKKKKEREKKSYNLIGKQINLQFVQVPCLLDRYKFVKVVVTKEDKEMNRTKINFEGSDVMLFGRKYKFGEMCDEDFLF